MCFGGNAQSDHHFGWKKILTEHGKPSAAMILFWWIIYGKISQIEWENCRADRIVSTSACGVSVGKSAGVEISEITWWQRAHTKLRNRRTMSKQRERKIIIRRNEAEENETKTTAAAAVVCWMEDIGEAPISYENIYVQAQHRRQPIRCPCSVPAAHSATIHARERRCFKYLWNISGSSMSTRVFNVKQSILCVAQAILRSTYSHRASALYFTRCCLVGSSLLRFDFCAVSVPRLSVI